MMKRRMWIFLFIIISLFATGVVHAEANEIVDGNWYKKYENVGKIQLLSSELDEARYKVKRGLLDLEDGINVSDLNIYSDQVRDVYFGILRENPKIFYVGGFSYSYNPNSQKVIAIRPEYIYDKSRIPSMLMEVEDKIGDIIATIIDPNMSEFDKERALHDHIVLNTSYDEENYYNDAVPKDSYNIYGTLIKGVAVCEGYSETLKLLLNTVGIECQVVAAPEMDHAWNIVTIDGKKYHVDATWNDPVPDRKGYVRYRYLNLPDAEMKKDHIWDYSRYPECDSDDFSYLWEMESPRTIEGDIYYFIREDSRGYIYKLNLRTLDKEQIIRVGSPYFDIAGDWIYFINYSNGYLYKTSLQGGDLTQLNDIHSGDIYREGNYIHYTEQASGVERRIKVLGDGVGEPGEDYTGYKKWQELSNIPPDKIWTIRFNLSLDKTTVTNDNIYIEDRLGNILDNLEIRIEDKSVILLPDKNYQEGSYYLYIENLKSESGRPLKENVKMRFTISK